jgi:IMP dehydrogenase
MKNPALTYDDIQLIPTYSDVESRSKISLKTKLSRNYNIMLPFVASPMDTVCEVEMAIKLLKMGGVGCIHRFMTIEEQTNQIKEIQQFLYSNKEELQPIWGDERKPIMAAVGATGDYLERTERLVTDGANVILIDVAHGHHINVKSAISKMIEFRETTNQNFDIIAGNVATYQGAYDLCKWGVDGLRVGIGGGSLCVTRVETGHGIPNVTSIDQCVLGSLEASNGEVPVMADGGIRTAGDVAKAIAAGADSVMLGSLFAGTQEAPGLVIENGNHLYKRYRGSASLETKSVHNQSNRNVEGVSTVIPYKGGVKFVIYRLRDGLQSALSYTGAHSIPEYHSKVDWVVVTNAGVVEATPHGLTK